MRYMNHRHTTMSTRVGKVNACELTRQNLSIRVIFSVSVLFLVRLENCRLHNSLGGQTSSFLICSTKTCGHGLI